MHSTTLKIKSYLDKEGFRTLSHTKFFEDLKYLIMDAFECTTKATSLTIAKVNEFNCSQYFKSALSNNNQRSIEQLPKRKLR